MVQTFAHGYDGTLPDGTKVEQGMGARLTLQQIDATTTARNLHPESRRRWYGCCLEALDKYGVVMGIGTAWRVQPENKPGHADPGNSWHEKVPFFAYAIDTVPASSWSTRDKLIAKYGLVNFGKPQTGGTNYTGRAYTGPWDLPHVQPYELKYSRSWVTVAPELRKWKIEPKYDIDIVGLNFQDHPLWGGDEQPNPPLNPPAPEVPPTPVQPINEVVFLPESRIYGLWPLGQKRALRLGDTGDDVKYLQAVIGFEVSRFAAWFLVTEAHWLQPERVLCFTAIRDTVATYFPVDGDYGPRTEQMVKWIQQGFSDMFVDGRTVGHMEADGVCGPSQTFPFIDSLADGEWL